MGLADSATVRAEVGVEVEVQAQVGLGPSVAAIAATMVDVAVVVVVVVELFVKKRLVGLELFVKVALNRLPESRVVWEDRQTLRVFPIRLYVARARVLGVVVTTVLVHQFAINVQVAMNVVE